MVVLLGPSVERMIGFLINLNRSRQMYVVDRTLRVIAAAIVGAAFFVSVGTGAVNAQQQPSQPITVSAFMANPGQLLQQYPSGGTLMIAVVQQLALADPATFKVLMGLLPN